MFIFNTFTRALSIPYFLLLTLSSSDQTKAIQSRGAEAVTCSRGKPILRGEDRGQGKPYTNT